MLKPLAFAKYVGKPEIYTPHTSKFWDDEHISKGMLDAHLSPEWDAASRKATFIAASADWITAILSPNQSPDLLDLGCGPGLYAEKFHQAGYKVTGIDYSSRSILYAQEQNTLNGTNITYLHQNYLNLEYTECFDVVTLIYCDYGVLPPVERRSLLNIIFKALRPGGSFILDVYTSAQHKGKREQTDWRFHSAGGFWSELPHLCLNSFFRYAEENTVLNQAIVVTDDTVNCYNIWECCFTADSLSAELQEAGFGQIKLYGDATGKEFDPDGNMICALAFK